MERDTFSLHLSSPDCWLLAAHDSGLLVAEYHPRRFSAPSLPSGLFCFILASQDDSGVSPLLSLTPLPPPTHTHAGPFHLLHTLYPVPLTSLEVLPLLTTALPPGVPGFLHSNSRRDFNALLSKAGNLLRNWRKEAQNLTSYLIFLAQAQTIVTHRFPAIEID